MFKSLRRLQEDDGAGAAPATAPCSLSAPARTCRPSADLLVRGRHSRSERADDAVPFSAAEGATQRPVLWIFWSTCYVYC